MTNEESIPFVEDVIVVRRRLRINNGNTEEQLLVWTSTKEDDATLAMLLRAQWAAGHGDHIYEPDMQIEGLPEPEDLEITDDE